MSVFPFRAPVDDGLQFTEAGILEAVGTVWETMLGLTPTATGGRPGLAGVDPGTDSVTGCVQLVSPTSRGGVLVQLPRALAAECAAILFQTTPADLGLEDVLDVVGELTNMIAGSLTRTLGSSASLTTPIIFSGTADDIAMPKSVTLHQVHLMCKGHRVGVRVVRQTGSAGGTR